MVDAEIRLARNEELFREVNERLAELSEHFGLSEEPSPVGFICECQTAACTESVEMTLADYKAVRAQPTRFLVVPGHERTGIENVVERHSTYLVVEKPD